MILKPVNILIADGHSVVREGLKQILANEFSNAQFGEAANGTEILKEIKNKTWDILIMDINMPGRDGLEILLQLKNENVNIPVLILSMHPEEHMALRAFKAGAYGYLTKEFAGNELINAINKVLNGKKYITPSIAEQLLQQIENPIDKKPHELLSNREYQTTLLIASGKTVTQIAEILSLSVATISTYRARILDKMNMRTNAELATYSIRQGLV